MNLTRIYTRTGDEGRTRLADNSPVAKSDPRLAAYGTVDEANCAIGVALATTEVPADVRAILAAIQNDLFDVGADVATPMSKGAPPALRVEQAWIDRLEGWCDQYNATLPPLRSFVLPGGCALAAQLHVARTVVRRAERAAWEAAQVTDVSSRAIVYLNRLSDLLFILSRTANRAAGVDDTTWVPAGDHR